MKIRSITYLALLWDFIKWAWNILIVGIVVSVLGSIIYTYITTGKMNFADPRTLTVLSWLSAHLFLWVPILTLLAILTPLSYLAKRIQLSSYKENEVNKYVLKRLDNLDPNNYIFPYVKHVYLTRLDTHTGRNADTIARAVLHEAAIQAGSSPIQKPLGICIFGRPTQGKTRLAWEAIHAELPTWILVKWPHEPPYTFDFAGQHGRKIILWLDDLHEFANPYEAPVLKDLPRRFQEAKVPLVIVATCRDGDNEAQARQQLEYLLERLTEIRLTDISPEEAEQLTVELTQQGADVQKTQFDGTPGSLLLGVQRMRNQRYSTLPRPARQVLKAMKVLHSARIYFYPASRVQATACDLFELNRSDWREACDTLAREGFVRLETIALDNTRTIKPVADVYLEQAVPDYPPPGADIADDWLQLLESLEQRHDAFALSSLGRAFDERHLGNPYG